MASKCPKCAGTRFEIRERGSQDTPINVTMQCATCGAVVAELSYDILGVDKLTPLLGYRLPD